MNITLTNKLYQTIGRMMYRIGQLNLAPDMKCNTPEFREAEELDALVNMLYVNDAITDGENSVPNYLGFNDRQYNELLDWINVTYNLINVPFVEQPKLKNIIVMGQVGQVGDGSGIPLEGRNTNAYLSTDVSGNLVWRNFNVIEARFDEL